MVTHQNAVAELIDVENPNRSKRIEEKAGVELTRKQKEELEKQKKKAAYEVRTHSHTSTRVTCRSAGLYGHTSCRVLIILFAFRKPTVRARPSRRRQTSPGEPEQRQIWRQ